MNRLTKDENKLKIKGFNPKQSRNEGCCLGFKIPYGLAVAQTGFKTGSLAK